MTCLHQDDALDELDTSDLGLLVTATDVHRRSLINQRERRTDAAKDQLLDDIDRLGRMSDLFKRAELERLREQVA